MRAQEISGGLYVMISEDESSLLEDLFVENEYISASDLSERQEHIVEELVKKGVLNPTIKGYKLV